MRFNTKFLVISTILIILMGVGAGFSGSGSGTSDDPYEISSCSELQEMEDDLSAHYELTGDVDCDGFDYSSVGEDDNQFTGVLDGQGYEVQNLEINEGSSNDVGLIGRLDGGGEVKDIGVVDVDVTGVYDVGGLIGYHVDGSVNNSYSTGSVTGDTYVGGLVGESNDGSVSNSYSTGSVSGEGDVGGLVGYNYGGSVSQSYSTGSVSGDSDVGGLIGINQYGDVSDGYWDTESSGEDSSDGGTGLTTSEMQGDACDMEGFSNSDWNFFDGEYPELEEFSSDSDRGNCPPTADFGSDSPVKTDEDFGLDASESSDPDGDSLSFEWDTDDDGNYDDETGESPSVSKSDDGSYEVGLRVDDGEYTDNTSKTVEVENREPSADFSFSPDDPVIEESIDFNASDSSDEDGSIESFEWDWTGDGDYEDTDEEVSHSFDSPGDKDVELRVEDDDGASDTVVETVTVGDVVVLNLDWSGYSSVVDPTGFNVYYGIDEIDEDNKKEVEASKEGTQISSEDWENGDNVFVEVRPFNSAGEAEGAQGNVTIQ